MNNTNPNGNNMNKIAMILVLILSAMLAGCSSHHKNNPVDPGDSSSLVSSSSVVLSSSSNAVVPSPTQFLTLTRIGDNTVTAKRMALAKVSVSDSTSTNLGPVKSTADFLFLPMNNSKGILSNIHFVSSNPKFEVSPKTISVIGIPGTSVEAMAILKVTAVHGKASSGTGFPAPLITADDASTDIVITGTYIDSTDTISFTTTYKMSVIPLYVSYKEFKSPNYLNMNNQNGALSNDTSITSWYSSNNAKPSGCGIIDTTAKGCIIRAYNIDTLTVVAGDTVRFHRIESDCEIDPRITEMMNQSLNVNFLYDNVFCDAPGDTTTLDPVHMFPTDYAKFPIDK